MASGKRASMREGPLAALFRRTEEEGLESGKEEQRPAEPEGDEPREGRAPEPATAAAREREPGGETEESSPPAPTVPTPRERLRHAFSADIPENILDPSASAAGATRAPAAPGAPATTEPPDAYARPGGDLYGQPAPVGAPVLRVVGVGGAGVNAVNRMVEAEIEGILPTLVDSRTVHAKEAIEILEENFGDRVFASRIRKTVRFAEAPVKGMSVLKYDPDGTAAQAYRQLAEEVLENGKR